MGLSGISFGSLLVILLIVMVVFGTKRMRNIGEDLGAAVKSFKKGLKDIEGADAEDVKSTDDVADKKVIED